MMCWIPRKKTVSATPYDPPDQSLGVRLFDRRHLDAGEPCDAVKQTVGNNDPGRMHLSGWKVTRYDGGWGACASGSNTPTSADARVDGMDTFLDNRSSHHGLGVPQKRADARFDE